MSKRRVTSSEPRGTSKEVRPIYVIAGKDESLVNSRCHELLDRLIEPSQRAVGLLVLDGDQAQIATVLDELRTAPFLTDRRVVVVQDCDDFVSKYRPVLEGYFDAPCSTGVLILTLNSWPANTKLAKKLSTAGELVGAEPPKPWQMPAQLIEYATARHGKHMAKEAAEGLVEVVGDDWARLLAEVDKLALFVGSGREILVQHVRELASGGRMFDAFEIIEGLTLGQKGRAVERLRHMLSEDKDAQYTIVGAFAFHIRRLFQAKVLLDKGVSSADIAKELRLWNKKDQILAQVRRLTLEQLGACLQKLAEIDYGIKTGQIRPIVGMEQFILAMD